MPIVTVQQKNLEKIGENYKKHTQRRRERKIEMHRNKKHELNGITVFPLTSIFI